MGPPNSLAKQNYRSELRQTDWDFARENGTSGLAAFHWYPARFIPSLPGILINYFSEPGDVVLDPFCGSGTTLVESLKLGRRALGIDLNPIAAMISSAKLIPFERGSYRRYTKTLLNEAANLFAESRGIRLSAPNSLLTIPNYEENHDWYHPDTLRELGALWTTIGTHSGSKYTPVGLTAFSSILRSSCSQDKHWGWICDNCKPDNLVYRDALGKFSAKLAEYEVGASSLKAESEQLHNGQLPLAFKVVSGDCATVLAGMPEDSFDLVVTSPPYPGTTDYVSSQRLSFLWFSVNRDALRHNEIGSRHKRFRKQFLDEYLTEMAGAFRAIARVLKRNGFCCVVIGESPRRRPTVAALRIILQELGLAHDDSLTRRIGKQRSLFPIVHREQILILRKQ